ncbi:hypothetical protein BH10CYA1_BH10CYA1_17690 [soil metagenome]
MCIWREKYFHSLCACLTLTLLLSSFTAALAQTVPPPPGVGTGIDGGAAALAPPARRTQSTVPAAPYVDAIGQTSLIVQSAEQNEQSVIANVNTQLLQGSELGAYNETYMGLKNFWSDDIVSNLFQNIGQLIGRWVTELINGWVSDTVQFLTAFLRTFVLNPNVAVNGLRGLPGAGTGSDDISPYIRQAADVMYSIAVDLLLLLFILSIWKYWVDAAWRGGVNLMGAVGRLIFTSGLLLAWPTIYAFEIQITNEMIKAIFFSSADQVAMLDGAMAAAVKGGLVAGAGLLASAFAPVVGGLAGGALVGGGGGLVLGTVGEVVAFAGLIIYLFLGVVLITQLIYILVLKAIQTALLTAQYMFAPFFLVFFATPSTESITSGFIRSFVEVSLWTFCWVGLLKIMVILLFSDFNPWGKIIMSIGVLQLMISVPDFLSRARISPMSSFISAGMISGGLMSGMKALGGAAKFRTGQAIDYHTNQKYAARGLEQSNSVGLNGVNPNVQDPALLKSLKDVKNQSGATPPTTPPKTSTPPLETDPNAPKSPGDGGVPGDKPLKPTGDQPAGAEAATPPLKKADGHGIQKDVPPSTIHGVAVDSSKGNPGSSDAADALKSGAVAGDESATLNTAIVQKSSGANHGPEDINFAPPGKDVNAAGGVPPVGAGGKSKPLTPAPNAYTARQIAGTVPVATDLDRKQGNYIDPSTMILQSGDGDDGGVAVPPPPQSATPLTNPPSAAPAVTESPYDKYDRANYRNVPVRNFLTDIRTAVRSMGTHSGTSSIIGDTKGNVHHARFNEDDTPEQKAQLLATGGFAQKYSTDPVGFDAARQSAIDAGADSPQGFFENMSAGFLAHNGKSFKQTALAKQRFQKALLQQAVVGSQAYVGMDSENANAYTGYLNSTYGEMTSDRQAQMIYLIEDEGNADSGWNPNRPAAIDLLTRTGLGVTNTRIAAASVEGVKGLAPWAKNAGILSVSALLDQKADSHFAGQNDVHPMVRDAFVGQIADTITPSDVASCLAIMIEAPNAQAGTELCRNEALVQSVSSLVSGGYQRDHATAVKSLGEIARQLQSGSAPPPGGRMGNIPQNSSPPYVPPYVPPYAPSNPQSANTFTPVEIIVDQQDDFYSAANGGADLSFDTVNPAMIDYTSRDSFQSGSAQSGPAANRPIRQTIVSGGSSSSLSTSAALSGSSQEQILHAHQIIMQAHDAGFDDRQLRVPNIAKAVVSIHNQPHLMRPAAMAAAVLSPEELTVDTIKAADQMVAANWNQIGREDLIAGQSIVQQNGYPDRQAVQIVRQNPDYTPTLSQSPGGDWQVPVVPNQAVQDVNKVHQGRYGFSSLQPSSSGLGSGPSATSTPPSTPPVQLNLF